jgi:tRNA 2-thiouridine synthesizing protein D
MGKGADDMTEKKTLTILLTIGPYVSESADMAVNTAMKAKKMGYNVNMFLYLDGTWLSHLTEDKGFNNPGEWLNWAIKKGITVCACERCSIARDLKEEEIIDGIKITGFFRFIDMLRESDKVLTFGG